MELVLRSNLNFYFTLECLYERNSRRWCMLDWKCFIRETYVALTHPLTIFPAISLINYFVFHNMIYVFLSSTRTNLFDLCSNIIINMFVFIIKKTIIMRVACFIWHIFSLFIFAHHRRKIAWWIFSTLITNASKIYSLNWDIIKVFTRLPDHHRIYSVADLRPILFNWCNCNPPHKQ